MIDNLDKGKANNRHHYASEYRQLNEAIRSKHRQKLKASVLLLHDKAPVYTENTFYIVAVAESAKCTFELLPHRPYTPDFALSDFFLFPKLKSHRRRHYFWNNDDVINAVVEFLKL